MANERRRPKLFGSSHMYTGGEPPDRFGMYSDSGGDRNPGSTADSPRLLVMIQMGFGAVSLSIFRFCRRLTVGAYGRVGWMTRQKTNFAGPA